MRNATLPPSVSSPPSPRRLSSIERRRRIAERDEWVRKNLTFHHFTLLFNELSGLYFFAKDRHGRLMFFSRGALERFEFRDDADAIGLTDFDMYPESMAADYALDDAEVYATGEPIRGRIQLWWNWLGVPDWYTVTKLPIHSRRGKIIGIMGILQRCDLRTASAAPFREIAGVVSHIREHYAQPLVIAELARMAHVSPRQLERKFRDVLGITPQQFLIKARVLAACHALRQSGQPIAKVSTDCGFYDQSSFTQHFRRHTGMTPRAYRRSQAGD